MTRYVGSLYILLSSRDRVQYPRGTYVSLDHEHCQPQFVSLKSDYFVPFLLCRCLPQNARYGKTIATRDYTAAFFSPLAQRPTPNTIIAIKEYTEKAALG